MGVCFGRGGVEFKIYDPRRGVAEEIQLGGFVH